MTNHRQKKRDIRGSIFFAFDHFRKVYQLYALNRFVHLICYLKGLSLGKNIKFNGIPIINRYPNSTIKIGDNGKFNSSRYSISVGLHQHCAFATLGENAFIEIGQNCGASGLKIHAKSGVRIGNNVLFGAGCLIFDNDAHHADPEKRKKNTIPSKQVTIGDNVFLGTQCVILKGVTIGKNAVIAARSVVFSNIPENCIAAGNPCKLVIKKVDKETNT